MKKFLLFLIMLSSFSLPVMAQDTACIPKSYDGHSYRIFKTEKTWEEAEAYCESLGGHLATVTSWWENDFLKQFSDYSNLWIGLTCSSGSWAWITGEPVSYSYWYYSNPSKSSDYRGYVTSSYSYKGEWQYGNSSNTKGFVCEWDYVIGDEFHFTHEWDEKYYYENLDTNNHNKVYPCKNCNQGKKIAEPHSWIEGYDWSSYYYTEYPVIISNATLFQPGTENVKCKICKNVITRQFAWEYGRAGSTSYDIVDHSYVFKSTKKITVKLATGLKGAVLKASIGGKKYSKKLTSNATTIKFSIKKPSKYGKKIKFELYYKGRLVGKDVCDRSDYIWYAKKVRNGMSKSQVKWTWGSPYSTSSASGGWSYWYWYDGSVVYFRNGKVKYWYDAAR